MASHTVTTVSLCSGVEGLGLGLSTVFHDRIRTLLYCEQDPFASELLSVRMQEGSIDLAPIWSDLHTLRTKEPIEYLRQVLAGKRIGLVFGGIPCQPFSVAGKKLGDNDPRDLWPSTFEFLKVLQLHGLGPSGVFFENVADSVRGLLDRIYPDLCELGFEVASGLFTAQEVGSPHSRERLFILGLDQNELENAQCLGRRGGSDENGNWLRSIQREIETSGRCLQLAHSREPKLAHSDRSKRSTRQPIELQKRSGRTDESIHSLFPPLRSGEDESWIRILSEDPYLSPVGICEKSRRDQRISLEAYVEPEVCELVNGFTTRLVRRRHELRLIGNSVVPPQASAAFLHLFAHITGGIE